jgi:hypothetical protein
MKQQPQPKKKGLDPESAFELQKIDCNCNDCGHMQRVKEIKIRWDYFMKEVDHKAYRDEKEKASYALYDKGIRGLQLNKVMFAKFQPTRVTPINYGLCKKLVKIVSFLPATFSFDTQDCFVHRKELK